MTLTINARVVRIIVWLGFFIALARFCWALLRVPMFKPED
jgi:hypothetical protein